MASVSTIVFLPVCRAGWRVGRKLFRPVTVAFILVGLAGALLGTGAEASGDEPLVGARLRDCYDLALKRSETIAIQREVIKEAEARFQQALSTVLPEVSFVASEKWQDGSGASSSTLRRVPQQQFTLTQPLFSGFKEFAAMASTQAEQRQFQQELVHAQQQLFLDVVDAFYLLARYEEDLEIVNGIQQALGERLEELKRRVALGRSRDSEVASTEVRFYQAQTDLETVRSQVDVGRQLLEFLVGREVVSLDTGGLPEGPLAPENVYVDRVESRPDVRAQAEASQSARRKIAVARSGHFPDVSVDANSYVKRAGAADGVDWDVALNVEVPLFDGGQTRGQVKEARAVAKEAELRRDEVRRRAVLDIKNAYTVLRADQRQRALAQKTVAAAERNYDLQRADYKNSLVNNLAVLDALQDLQAVRRSYNAINNEARRAFWRLKVAVGDSGDDPL